MNDFEEYIRQGEPHKRAKGYAWQTAIGLQAVDGLKPSTYLIETARKHIEGDIPLFANHSWYFRNALVRANYQNVQKGIQRTPEYLERFFRNLLMGEKNSLRNRDLLIQVPENLLETKEETANRTSTEQPTEQLTEQERLLLSAIGQEQFSLKVSMEKVGLKHRPTFLENYINPAIRNGLIKVLYPENPNHPRQKYLLTIKGMALYNDLNRR